MKRVLLTGATGRIGRRVMPLLLDRGYHVIALIHHVPAEPDWPPSVETIKGAVSEPKVLDDALRSVDAVIHLAALMPPALDEQVFHTNIEGTYRLLDGVAKLKHKPRVLFASSDATYCTGWSLGAYSSPIDESSAQHPTVFYGLSKVLGETMCRFYKEIYNVPLVKLRFVWTLEAAEVLDLFLHTPYKEFLLGRWPMGRSRNCSRTAGRERIALHGAHLRLERCRAGRSAGPRK